MKQNYTLSVLHYIRTTYPPLDRYSYSGSKCQGSRISSIWSDAKKLVHQPLTVRKVSYITQDTAQSIFNVNKFTAKPNNESILKIDQHLTTVKTKEQLQWPGCVTDPTGKQGKKIIKLFVSVHLFPLYLLNRLTFDLHFLHVHRS